MGPLPRASPGVHLLAGSPHLLPRAGLPARPAAAGAADPAQRMPVIPLCRLAGVRGHGEKRGGLGDREGRRGGLRRREQGGAPPVEPSHTPGAERPAPLRAVENSGYQNAPL